MSIDSIVASLKELAKDSKNIEEIYENLEFISDEFEDLENDLEEAKDEKNDFEDDLKLEIEELKQEHKDEFDSMLSLLRIIKEAYETNNFSESIINQTNAIAFKYESSCMLWEHNKK